MKRFLRGFGHFVLSVFVSILVIPVLLTIIFAMAGIHDAVGPLPLIIGILCFPIYWFQRAVRDTGDAPGPPVELPPDDRRSN